MNVLIVGGGGREHVLAWKIAQSPLVNEVFCAPGNPGIGQVATCVDIAVSDHDGLVDFAKAQGIGLTVVGPEAPLVAGLVDRLEQAGLQAFGPRAGAAQLEGSKRFAKDFMARHAIPTAAYREFDDPGEAAAYVRAHGTPIVIKADGLAAGKGVTVAHTIDDAEAAIRASMVEGVFGAAGSRVVVEEFLEGEEASILALTDGHTIVPLLPSQDHKPALDGDRGPNTGGMGAYAPAPLVTEALSREIMDRILQPCVEGMAGDGVPYRGVLYAGLMIGPSGPKVVEFNCRFGDPEVQVVLPLLESDLVPHLLACCEARLGDSALKWSTGGCVTVVMASGGYPGSYETGKAISGIAEAESEHGALVFHAGTKRAGGGLVTGGGRVLNVTARGAGIADAIENAYAAVRAIHFDGAHYRTDIGRKALARA